MKLRPDIRRRARPGQTLVFLGMMLVILVFVVMWNFDLHKVMHVKGKARNGGDAASLAGARWQATSLNTLGEINVAQATEILEQLSRDRDERDWTATIELGDIGKRLAFVGPMIGLDATQQAAKHNGIMVNDHYTVDMAEHAAVVMNDYALIYNAPWDGSAEDTWGAYADMILAVAANGVSVEIENAKFTGLYSGPHILLDPSFYDAVAGRNWCWFLHRQPNLLSGYSSWQDWPPLPDLIPRSVESAEYLNLDVQFTGTLFDFRVRVPENGLPDPTVQDLADEVQNLTTNELVEVPARFAMYGSMWYTTWSDFIPSDFPFDGEVRPEYEYVGADVATRIETPNTRATPGAADVEISWTSAAKPFGYLEGGEGRQPPQSMNIVLPAFREVGLIPVDTSTAPAGGTRAGWVQFIYYCLPAYMEGGPAALLSDPVCAGNWYSLQLLLWEEDAFRNEGEQWLDDNRDACFRRGGGGGGGGGGGARRGH